MRVAGNSISRNYIKNLERNLSQKYGSENKINSYRKFQKASECPAQAASAMRVRKAIANIDIYQTNLKTANNIYSNAESSLNSVSELIQTSYEKLIEAANGTHTEDQNGILATEIETNADEIMRLMNITVADRKIFGGTNNSTNAFSIETSSSGSKTVMYNGMDVGLYSDPTMYPNSSTSFADIGLGMSMQADGSIDPQSALAMTFNGAEYLGCGAVGCQASLNLGAITDGASYSFKIAVDGSDYTVDFTGGADTDANIAAINAAFASVVTDRTLTINDSGVILSSDSADSMVIKNNNRDTNGDGTLDYSNLSVSNRPTGYSNNVIQGILDAAAAVRKGDIDAVAKFADRVYSLQTTVSLSLAKIGNAESFIEFNTTRLDNNLLSLQERQNDLESTDLAAEATTWKTLQAVYDATLQMSASVIPQSIFNFL